MKLLRVAQGLSINGKNKRAVAMCAHQLAQFSLVTQGLDLPAVGLLWAAFEHGDSSCLCFCDHVSNKCYHSAGIQMFGRRQLLLVKAVTRSAGLLWVPGPSPTLCSL